MSRAALAVLAALGLWASSSAAGETAAIYPRALGGGALAEPLVARLIARLEAALAQGGGRPLRTVVDLERELVLRAGADYLACRAERCAVELAQLTSLRKLVLLDLASGGPGCGAALIVRDLLLGEVELRAWAPGSCGPAGLEAAVEVLAGKVAGWSREGAAAPERREGDPATAWLRLESEPEGMWAELDGRDLGRLRGERLEVSAGKHHLVVEGPCHQAAVRDLELAPGSEQTVRLALVQLEAVLSVRVGDSDARRGRLRVEVWLDGRRLGPNERTYTVPACARQLEVRAPGFPPHREVLWLNPSEAKLVDVDLRPGWGEQQSARYAQFIELKPEKDVLERRVERCLEAARRLGRRPAWLQYEFGIEADGAPVHVSIKGVGLPLPAEDRRCVLVTIDRFRFSPGRGWDQLGLIGTKLVLD